MRAVRLARSALAVADHCGEGYFRSVILGRRKNAKKPDPRPVLVPTEPPVFSALERLGAVVVMSETGAEAGPKPPPVAKPRPRKRK